MKRIMIIICAIAVILSVVITTIIQLDSKYNMRHYFDNWQAEVDEEIAPVLNDYYVYYRDKKVDLHDISPGYIREVYCVNDDRIYFCYSTSVLDSGAGVMWHIASIGLDGENLINHYSCNLFDKSDYLTQDRYIRLSYQEYNENYYGGFYDDNKIYLHGIDRTVVYDICNDTACEVNEYPISRYRWNFNETHSEVTIEDCEQNLCKTVTLESMAEKNNYAKKLLELSSRKIWSGESSTYKIFSMVRTVEDQIYLICEVLNWNGESFAVVFQYDFSLEHVLYVSSTKTSDLVNSRYSFALCEP